MKSFGIVLVCYNRLGGIKRLLNQLEKANYSGRKDIHLIFSIDNSGKEDVLKFAESYEWKHGEKRIRTFPERQGLKKHILQCGDFTNDYDIVTILEDDVFVSDSFYQYAYSAAEYYWDEDNVAGISLYNFQKNWLNWNLRFEPQKKDYDAYFLKIAQSWGQVWTKSKWDKFKEWYENNQEFERDNRIPEYLNTWPETSWLKYHDKYCIETNRYFVYPYVSLSTNFSDAGEHNDRTVTDHQVELQYGKLDYKYEDFSSNAIIYDEYMNRQYIGKYIGIDNEDLCVDFWATKNPVLYKRYLLTTQKMKYKLIKSFSLSLRPIELSVIENLEGKGIFLYDTTVQQSCNKEDNEFRLMEYSMRTHDARRCIIFSVKLLKQELIRKIKKVVKKLK